MVQPFFFGRAIQNVFRNKYKYIVLSFTCLVGCMCGYYSVRNISYTLGLTLRENFAERFWQSGADIRTLAFSILYGGIVWLCGYTAAGLFLLPFALFFNAFIQVFILNIIMIDTGIQEAFFVLLSILLTTVWAVCCILLCEISMENAMSLAIARKLQLSLTEKAFITNRNALRFTITTIFYSMISMLAFLSNRAIF